LFFDYTFIACNIVLTIPYYFGPFEELSTELVISKLTIDYNRFTPEEFSGFILATMSFGSLVANFLSGLLLDKFKKYYYQTNIAAFLSFLCCTALLISVTYRSFVGVILSCFFLGFSKRTCYVSLFDSLMQHTYPSNPLFVMSWGIFVQSICALLFINIGRQIIYNTSLIGGLVYLCIAMGLVCILCLIFKPITNRLKAGETKSETTALLSEPDLTQLEKP